ncbi:MAG: NACHT domain-containing NTPase [Xenococcus sp. (in: cyanobacteria)]
MRVLSSLLSSLTSLLTNEPSQRNINYGGDQNIFNQPKNVNFYALSNRSRNERILLRAVQDEVKFRLANSLHNAVFLILGKEAQPEQVKCPWDREIKIGTKEPIAIPDDMTMAQVFDEINGKLLILGAPGSGKTTTLLELAKALVEKALSDESYPIPVLFNLSRWQDETQPIRDWMVEELRSKYGVNRKLGQQWMRERLLLPLLDGLDEVAPGREEKCVEQINSFLVEESSPIYAVVCSRTAQYESFETSLQLNGSVYLKELNDKQIQEYLTRVDRKDLWQFFAHNSTLLELLRAPLLLSIAVLAYSQGKAAQWQQLEVASDQLQFLLGSYVERMLHRPSLGIMLAFSTIV